ncbi:MAG: hypothetical protein NPMRth3_1070004 [Nitrosopumilales archaeon]|nr:MAG: hypothetical protein NPMRth3_1070004 [Nitrosopumilales archaeon]
MVYSQRSETLESILKDLAVKIRICYYLELIFPEFKQKQIREHIHYLDYFLGQSHEHC